jgi:hypothetical protein
MGPLKGVGLTICVTALATWTIGCNRAQSPTTNSQAAHAGLSNVQGDGSSTGGGSFGDESALTILDWASEDLAQEILNSSPEIYRNLPKGWTQEKLAQLVRNVEPTKGDRETYSIPEVSRYGTRLVFNYVPKADGRSYITATRQFIDAYAAYEVNSKPKKDFYATINEVKLKLAHEVSHLLGFGLTRETNMPEARAFAEALLASLDSDNVECLPSEPLPAEAYTPLENGDIVSLAENHTSGATAEEKLKKAYASRTRAFVFNRPSGRAAVPTNVGSTCTVEQQNTGSIDRCGSSQDISVFAPRSYTERFELATIRTSVYEGVRAFGTSDGYFSWKLVDPRQAVLTDEGYKSDFNYQASTDANSFFSEYMDFQVRRSSADDFDMVSFPPLAQENWTFYRSQGQSEISLHFNNGQITSADLIVLKNYNGWANDPALAPVHIVTPLKCVRSYKILTLPHKN